LYLSKKHDQTCQRKQKGSISGKKSLQLLRLFEKLYFKTPLVFGAGSILSQEKKHHPITDFQFLSSGTPTPASGSITPGPWEEAFFFQFCTEFFFTLEHCLLQSL